MPGKDLAHGAMRLRGVHGTKTITCDVKQENSWGLYVDFSHYTFSSDPANPSTETPLPATSSSRRWYKLLRV
eukprot:2599412-Rhodomonas_salina.1